MSEDIDFALKNPSRLVEEMLSFTQLTLEARYDLLDHYIYNRAYHGLFHLGFLWHTHCRLSRDWINGNHVNAMHKHQRMANAIACHDVIMATDGTSEIQSALWWMDNHTRTKSGLLTDLSFDDVLWVRDAIVASQNHFVVRTEAPNALLNWFLGLDLLPLAAPPEIFDQNTLLIRAEYGHLSDAEWSNGRYNFLQKICDLKTPIYQHPLLHRFETAARRNISRVLNAACEA